MGKASTTKTMFSRTTTIEATINTPSDVVWNILTNTNNYTAWNSTIVSINGEITLGNTIQLVSRLDPQRTFKLKVKQLVPNQLLVWGDPMGKRTYKLTQNADTTHLTMTEKIGGPLFPLFASKIPPFDESFEKFVLDLKKEAEK